ncbi:MAG: hypothetical protein A2951_00085 [Candidatus Buchananbacteria bacterium RIFCSPLOWO2_01_FULL_56_15]|uniref:Uncharacterized protein n=2 Tax=Candidatus Buchananiibacteriota TaxID=1817903 RepID=A0A1G1YF35_9BACT|nr:MAG: hypothetical protein A3J59_00530 [Candidatus Buchananbacteria bacterium RIFCSPHIGHO2_02_FULL_56_16]OGY55006.1 MAG: hypothetical protein A2951_00085 [Candidatus Buchananbacteria bacterium RIFCSPLOWO2_01_FULL_56_15]
MTPQATAKRAIIIFGLAFGLNFIWEYFHARLYLHYRGGPITELVLLRATLLDALFITGLFIAVYTIPFFYKNRWRWTILFSFAAAVLLERYALATGRWAYANAMPLIPLLKTGLTPTIQLALLAVLAFRLAGEKKALSKFCG